MEQRKQLTPWIVPKWAILGFDGILKDEGVLHDEEYYIKEIIVHNEHSYLVITIGDNTDLFGDLTQYLHSLFSTSKEAKDHEETL